MIAALVLVGAALAFPMAPTPITHDPLPIFSDVETTWYCEPGVSI